LNFQVKNAEFYALLLQTKKKKKIFMCETNKHNKTQQHTNYLWPELGPGGLNRPPGGWRCKTRVENL